jgi:hydroxyacylglutathione hydrolase
MFLRQVFDPALAQYAYLIGCQRTGQALIIDPERDIDRYRKLAEDNGLRLTAVAETHIHADFVSGSQELVRAIPDIHLYLSDEGGKDWSYRWPKATPTLHLLKHGDTFKVGGILVEAVHSPGHTPEHLSFLITDRGGGADEPMALATGDFLFVGDVGRPDLLETAAGAKGVMEPSARRLQEALVGRLAGYQDYLQILPGHGAGSSCGKSLGAVPITTLGYERRFNHALQTAADDPSRFVRDILTGQPDPPLYFARMKQVNRDGIAVTGGTKPIPQLDRSRALAFSEGPHNQILDLRPQRQDFSRYHLKGSLHAPFGTSFYLAAAGSYIAADEAILLVLEDEKILDQAVRQLYRIGLDHIEGWVWAGDLPQMKTAVEMMPRMEFEEFDQEAARKNGVILDVRTTMEYEAGHIQGALSIPYTRLRARLDEVPRDKPILVHCGTGRRAALAASFLRSEGVDAVLVDGICVDCDQIARARNITH